MGVLLSHIGLEPIIYGIIVALGLIVWTVKFKMGQWLSLGVDIGVFWLVFSLHGGTMTGGMAAAMASLICGLILPLMFRKRARA